MGRLDAELLERFERFSHRVTDVAEEIEKQRRFRRVIDQIVGCGTSVGANMSEADEALSRADFCSALGIVLKELSEVRYWMRFIGARGWISQRRLGALLTECEELRRIAGAMRSRTRRRGT